MKRAFCRVELSVNSTANVLLPVTDFAPALFFTAHIFLRVQKAFNL